MANQYRLDFWIILQGLADGFRVYRGSPFELQLLHLGPHLGLDLGLDLHGRLGPLLLNLRRQALVEAIVGRLRPIIVTTISTLGGVLPLAYGLGGYDAILSPMSLALGWGILLSTPVTLFLVPCLYTLASDLGRRSAA